VTVPDPVVAFRNDALPAPDHFDPIAPTKSQHRRSRQTPTTLPSALSWKISGGAGKRTTDRRR
jgi:hypothetical protein